MRRSLFLGSMALLLSLAPEMRALAQDEGEPPGPEQAAQAQQPVIVEYVAAEPGCASRLAFQVLVETEVARRPSLERRWRWSVHVRRRGGVYEGTLASERGTRILTAPWCDDVTAAFAVLIARGDPVADLAVDPPCAPAAPPPPAPPPPPPAVEPPPARDVSLPREVHRDASPPAEWRLGARGEVSSHSYTGAALDGAFGVVSVELPWGPRKTQFEVAVGGLSAAGPDPITYLVVDTQTCLLDLPLGASGLSALGCLRLAGASFKAPFTYDGVVLPQNGGALWVGAGARLRWQSSSSLFVEASLDGVYGTVSAGESLSPGWVAASFGAGFRL